MKYLAPSLLAADFSDLKTALHILKEEGISYLHLDVMDGNFVPSISFGMPVIKSLRGISDLIFDVHMMVEDPARYIKDLKDAGANRISVHYEADKHIDRTLNLIKGLGLKAGIVLNPATPISVLENILPLVDFVLLMSVNPGFGGQKYIEYSTDKIKALADIRKTLGLHFEIQVDGGICLDNIEMVVAAGADNLVAGSAVFQGDIAKNIRELSKFLV